MGAGMAMEENELSSIPKLKNAETYPLWNFEMRIMLRAKQLYKIVNGEDVLAQDANANVTDQWKTKDAKAQYYILRTIDQHVKPHILTCETAKDMYDTLKNIYDKQSAQQKQQLQSDFFNYTWNKSKDVMTNISHVQNIVFRLKTVGEDISDDMMITKIMTILPDQYKHFRSAWDSASVSDKNLDNLKSRLSKEEDFLKGNYKEEAVAFKAFKSRNNKKAKNTYPPCGICKKRNHLEDNCFFKDNEKKNKQNLSCTICKKTNHTEENCFYKDRYKDRKNEKVSFLTEVHISEKKITADFNKGEFVIDSACNAHLTNEENILQDAEIPEEPVKINVAKRGNSMTGKLVGIVETDNVIFKDVTYVPKLSKNLLSVNAITEHDGEVLFTKNQVCVFKDNEVMLRGYKNNNGLYVVNIETTRNSKEALATSRISDDWHKKLGHISFNNLKKIPQMCSGVPETVEECKTDSQCETCLKAKLVKNPFNTERKRATRPLQIIHSDVCGKIDPPTYNNKNYFMTCVDDYTHFVKVYLLQHKSEAVEFLKEFINESEAHFNIKTSKIRCDNGGEYSSNSFKTWCKNKGIVLNYTIPYTPQHNGTSERMNRTLVNKVRALLFDSYLENDMWGEAVYTAAYLVNRSPTTTKDKTPAELWYGHKPNLSKLQIFGSVVYTRILGSQRKLDPRSKRGIFVGYSENGYRIMDPSTQETYVSKDVVFLDVKNSEEKSRTFISVENIEKDDPNNEDNENNDVRNENNQLPVTDVEDTESEAVEDIDSETDEDPEDENQEQDQEEVHQETVMQRHRRQKKLPQKFQDYVIYDDNEALMSYTECMSSPEKQEWEKAIQEEKQSLKKNDTWQLVNENCANGKEIVTGRWIFKVKDEGKYKARLVARGCQQNSENLDFKDIFSTVVQTGNLRLLFALAAQRKMKIITFDVKTAFLNGNLEEEIYMKIPEGYNAPGKICLLKKALYGLKQAPLQWNKRLTEFLTGENLKQLKTDQCVFKTKNKDKKMFLAVHVDDGILFGEDEHQMKILLEGLKKNFEITVQENPTQYLGLEIRRVEDGIFINQARYSKQVLNKYQMNASKPVSTPIAPPKKNLQALVNESSAYSNFPYREVIGSLLYLSCKTRPDLAYAVNYESRSMEKPTSLDISNVKRTLRYLNGHQKDGIFYSSKTKDCELIAYSDADFAGDLVKSKSTSGYIILYGGGPVSWCSRKQSVVAQSTTEAEYTAAAQCCQEMKYIKAFLHELLGEQIQMTLYVDNQSAIQMIKSGQITRRSKHIDVKFHFVSDELSRGWYRIEHCFSQDQLADILTKPLHRPVFDKLKTKLMCV